MPDDSRTPLPRRVPGAADGPKPPRRVLPPALAQDVLDRLRPEAGSADGNDGPGPARPGHGSPIPPAAARPVPARPEYGPPVPARPEYGPPVPARPPAGKPAARRRSSGGRWYAIAAAVVVIGIAGSLAFAIARSPAATGPDTGRPASVGSPVRDLAAGWVAAQVSRTVVVSCDPAMCRLLGAHGVPPAGLFPLRPGSSPLGSKVIVATAIVRGWFGSRLSTVYAPEVLATFGSGEQRIDVRVIAPNGPAAYLAALTADLQSRKLAGRQLLASPRIGASAAAERQLVTGQVDPRLIVTIADLGSLEPVYVVSFGGSAPGASPAVPLRSADLAETGQTPRLRAYYAQTFMSFLHAPGVPYRAAHIESLQLSGGQAILRIEFAAPTPLGLVGPTG